MASIGATLENIHMRKVIFDIEVLTELWHILATFLSVQNWR